MKIMTKENGTINLMKIAVFAFIMIAMLMFALSGHADNFSYNSTILQTNFTDNSSYSTNLTLNESLDNNLLNYSTNTSNNLTGINISDYNTSLKFEMMLEQAIFINDTYINFTGFIDIQRSIIDSNINYSEPVFAPVNISIHADILNKTYLYHCFIDVNGTEEFGCLAPNASYYVVVASALIENETLYKYAMFNNSEMYEELVKDFETMYDDSEDYVFGENLSMYVEFNEIYSNGSIYGDIFSNGNDDNNVLIVEVWPVNTTHSRYDLRETCEFIVSRKDSFRCPIGFMETGTYEINVTIKANNESFSVKEITYYVAPEYRIRIIHEGLYKLGDTVNVYGYTTLANSIINESMAIIIVDGPGNVTYRTEGINPELEFIADELGEYTIEYHSYFRGRNYSRTSKIFVAEPERFGVPKSKELFMDLDEVYPDDYELLVAVNLENIESNITENQTISFVVSEKSSNISLELSSKIKNNFAEIPYFIQEPGNYTFEVYFDEQNLSSSRNITVVDRIKYASENILTPLFDKYHSRNISGIVDVDVDGLFYNRTLSSYNVNLSLGEFSSVRLHDINNLENLKEISYSESNDSRIATRVFAVEGITIGNAEITIEKSTSNNIEAILHCRDWNYTSYNCTSWDRTTIPFTENQTHVSFNVTSFSAYAGGLGFNSQMLVWDSTDEEFDNKTAYVDDYVLFFANYTTFPGNVSIETANCSVEINGTNRTMAYNSTTELYWYNTTFPERGIEEYTVYCTDDSYDDLSAKNNLTIYSNASITEIALTRNDITLGYALAISCEVEDVYENEGIYGYNVSFYSSIEGLIGSQITDVMGWSSVAFTPKETGEHTLSCEISDYDEEHYKTSISELSDTLDVELSSLRLEKNAVYNDSGSNNGVYNITLEISNNGGSALFDISLADFIPDGFTPVFTINPVESHIATVRGKSGTIHVWEIESLNASEVDRIKYSVIPDMAYSIYDISDSYIIGTTYEFN